MAQEKFQQPYISRILRDCLPKIPKPSQPSLRSSWSIRSFRYVTTVALRSRHGSLHFILCISFSSGGQTDSLTIMHCLENVGSRWSSLRGVAPASTSSTVLLTLTPLSVGSKQYNLKLHLLVAPWVVTNNCIVKTAEIHTSRVKIIRRSSWSFVEWGSLPRAKLLSRWLYKYVAIKKRQQQTVKFEVFGW